MEFETEDIAFLGLGLVGGFFSLFIIKSVHPSLFLKIASFVLTTIASGFLAKFIASRG